MQDGSNRARKDNSGFIGFRCSSAAKRRAKRRAEQEGTSVSELMRRHLHDLIDAADGRPASA